jgi:hypothetical protein
VIGYRQVKGEAAMTEKALNIFGPEEVVRLKAVLNEVVLALPKQLRSCEMQASLAEQLLKLAAGGEKDPIRLKERTLQAFRII